MKSMKKILLVLLTILLASQCLIASPKALMEEDIDSDNEIINLDEEGIYDVDNTKVDTKGSLRVSARNAIAIDAQYKQVLWDQKGYEIVPMASTTKILTSLIAINYGDLDRKVTISKNASSIRGSTVGYKAGEEITMRELLFGLMFRSGNDAAIAIAEDIGGSVEGFANIMNDFARSIGVLNSHFESPHGLDSQKHYSSAYDLAILAAKGMESEVFREIVGEKTILKDKYDFTRDYQNINKILYRIPGANGVKTGYTGQAGKCLVSSVNHDGRNIIIVVLNCVDRWNQTEKIYNYVISTHTLKAISKKELVENEGFMSLGAIIEDEEFKYGYKENDSLEVEVFKPSIEVKEGDVLGKIILKDNNKERYKTPLKSNTNIGAKEIERVIPYT